MSRFRRGGAGGVEAGGYVVVEETVAGHNDHVPPAVGRDGVQRRRNNGLTPIAKAVVQRHFDAGVTQGAVCCVYCYFNSTLCHS